MRAREDRQARIIAEVIGVEKLRQFVLVHRRGLGECGYWRLSRYSGSFISKEINELLGFIRLISSARNNGKHRTTQVSHKNVDRMGHCMHGY